jgi:hypothetical protein
MCGCLNRELVVQRHLKHGEAKLRTAEYRAWASMLDRCNNPNRKHYKYYGGRGIKVCERWMTFANFLADMGRRPSPLHSIDRWPNPDGDYEPGNCRWATRMQQRHNWSGVDDGGGRSTDGGV